MYLVCLPGFCFSSLSTAILFENENSAEISPCEGKQGVEHFVVVSPHSNNVLACGLWVSFGALCPSRYFAFVS